MIKSDKSGLLPDSALKTILPGSGSGTLRHILFNCREVVSDEIILPGNSAKKRNHAPASRNHFPCTVFSLPFRCFRTTGAFLEISADFKQARILFYYSFPGWSCRTAMTRTGFFLRMREENFECEKMS
jgi:hypothetical protein